MNQHNKEMLEMLSALTDGENTDGSPYSEADLLEQVCKDNDARGAWRNMHLTRDVLQADYHSALDSSFSYRVSDLIQNQEETYSNDALGIASVGATSGRATSGNVVALASRHEARRRPHQQPDRQAIRSHSTQPAPFSLWKPVAGLGLAASLAGASFLFAQLWQAEQNPGASLQVTTNTEGAAESKLIGTEIGSEIGTQQVQQQLAVVDSGPMQIDDAGTRWRTDTQQPRNEDVEERLNALLTNHLEDASMGVVHGILSHSRVVSYDSMPAEQKEN